jgi:hypothetical protein
MASIYPLAARRTEELELNPSYYPWHVRTKIKRDLEDVLFQYGMKDFILKTTFQEGSMRS